MMDRAEWLATVDHHRAIARQLAEKEHLAFVFLDLLSKEVPGHEGKAALVTLALQMEDDVSAASPRSWEFTRQARIVTVAINAFASIATAEIWGAIMRPGDSVAAARTRKRHQLIVWGNHREYGARGFLADVDERTRHVGEWSECGPLTGPDGRNPLNVIPHTPPPRDIIDAAREVLARSGFDIRAAQVWS